MNIRHALTISALSLAAALGACGQQDDTALANQSGGSDGFQPIGADGQPIAVTPANQEMIQQDGGQTDTGAMQTVQLMDPQSFGRPVAAATIDIPAGWRPEGGINWDMSTPCATNQMKMQWRATAPDGQRAFELMPGYSWQTPDGANQMNPCPVERIGNAREFLTMVAQRMRPGARAIGYRDRTAELPSRGERGEQYEAGQLKISYNQGGRETEEVLTTMFVRGQGYARANYVSAIRGPAGQLDVALGERIAKSMKPSKEYFAATTQRGTQGINAYSQRQSNQISTWHNNEMARINARGAADRAAIRSQTNREVAAINSQTYQNTVATNDRMNENTRQALNQESTWVNPNTGDSFQGSIHGGSRVLQTDDNSVIRTDDPYYNPSGSVELTPEN